MSVETIDWEATRRRLQASEAALARVLDVDGERLEVLLRERARRLATPERTAASRADSFKVLVARAGGERYALALTRLAGVLPFAQCAPVAGGPPELLGIINARGAIWAAFDLRRLLGTDTSAASAAGRVVLLRHSRRRVALRIDDADGVRELNRADLARPAAAPDASAPIISAVTSDALIVLDLDAIWTHPSIGEAR